MADFSFQQGVQQRQTQVIRAQMRQWLEALHLPLMELQTLITQAVETNPVLEAINPNEVSLTPAQDEVLANPEETPDYFLQQYEGYDDSQEAAERRQHFFDQYATAESLQEHLQAQAALSATSQEEYELLTLLIGNIDDNGRFTGSFPDLEMVLGCSEEHLERALAKIQSFDPVGVGARNLEECLNLQVLADKGPVPHRSVCLQLLNGHLQALAHHHADRLCDQLHCTQSDLRDILGYLKTLDPYPGKTFHPERTQIIEPELTAIFEKGHWIAQANKQSLPRLRISKKYLQMLEGPKTSPEVRSYLRQKIYSAKQLINTLQDRGTTLERVAQAILDAQPDFMDKGDAGLHPLKQQDIAKQLELHETTIGRAVNGKYIRTPRGVFELKHFFPHAVQIAPITEIGGDTPTNDMAHSVIQQQIKEIVSGEDPQHPLPDLAIQKALKARGIEIARRTIAKYRTALKIPSAHERRALLKP